MLDKKEIKCMTNKELSQTIRAQLKSNGYTSKDVSISVRSSGYADRYIKAIIKNPKINRYDVEHILKKYQDVDRDVDGSILQGCNTFVSVYYKEDIFIEPSLEWIATAAGVYKTSENIIRIFDGLYFISENGIYKIRQQDNNENVTYTVGTLQELAIFIYKFTQFKSIAI